MSGKSLPFAYNVVYSCSFCFHCILVFFHDLFFDCDLYLQFCSGATWNSQLIALFECPWTCYHQTDQSIKVYDELLRIICLVLMLVVCYMKSIFHYRIRLNNFFVETLKSPYIIKKINNKKDTHSAYLEIFLQSIIKQEWILGKSLWVASGC